MIIKGSGNSGADFRYIYRRFAYAGLFLLLVIAAGTIGYWYIWDMKYSLLDSFYMTMITVTTIGYGEIHDMSANPEGRTFTIIIAISGIGAFTYILTNFTAFIVGGELLKNFKLKRLKEMIKKTKNHFIICGAGDIGEQIADELKATKRPFVLIDKQRTEYVDRSEREIMFLEGDATDEEVLTAAGIDRCLGVFAVTGDDNINLVTTFTVKQLNNSARVITRCNDNKHITKLKKAGADSVVSTNLISSLRIVSEMVRPAVVTFLDTMLRDKEQNLRVEEIKIKDELSGNSIEELNLRGKSGALLLALRRGEEWKFNPAENTRLEKDDVMIFMLPPGEREKLEKVLT